jgi:integrase
MGRLKNPPMVVLTFVMFMDRADTPQYLIKDAIPAVKDIFHLINTGVVLLLNANAILSNAIRSVTAGVKRGSKHRRIWRLEVLLDFIRRGCPTEELAWMDLMTRAAALFIIFIPCRPVGVWRINPRREKWASDGKSVEVQVKEKTDHGRGTTFLVIRASEVPNLCPLTCYRLLHEGAMKRGVFDCLWCTEAGARYKQSSAISRFLKKLLKLAGVAAEFAAYSIRHALITWLFNHGWSELQVNAYTGHSNNSHTALDHYFH